MLAAEEPDYLKSLSLRYYPVSMSSRAFSGSEREWLSTHSSIRIGYLENYGSLCNTARPLRVRNAVGSVITVGVSVNEDHRTHI